MSYFEKQYNVIDSSKQENGICSLGTMTSYTWLNDPKRLLFVLSRYKVAASILSGEEDVLEIGCGDGFPARIVSQAVKKLTLCDIDQKFVEQAKQQSRLPYEFDTFKHNFLESETSTKYSACYLLDVLEHIAPSEESCFLSSLGAMCSSTSSK